MDHCGNNSNLIILCILTLSVVYDGLETYHSATYDDSLYLDATMNLGIAGLTTIQQKMVDNAQVQVCSSFTANDYNMYGDCPADGRYMFNSTYEFPAPGSAFMDWASSGYEGDIELEIYHNMDLVGRCVVDARTLVSGSYEKGAFGSTPSGKIGAIIALSLLGLLVLYILYRGVMAYRARQQKQTPKALPTETPEQGPATEYSRMETGDAPEVQETAPTQTRYTNDGPVI